MGTLSRYELPVTAAGPNNFVLPGKFLMVEEAPSDLTRVVVRNSTGLLYDLNGMRAGMSVEPAPNDWDDPRSTFQRIEIHSPADQTIALIIGDMRAAVQRINLTGGIAVNPADDFDTYANIPLGVIVEQLLPANSSRTKAHIQVDELAAAGIVLTNPAGGINRGLKIGVGQTFTMENTAAIWGRSIAGTVNVRIIEETRT